QLADSTPFFEGEFLEASDHRPLWLKHTTNLFTPYRAIIPNSPAEELFIQAIQQIWADVSNLPTHDIVDSFNRSFDHLDHLWKEYSTLHSPSNKSKTWWTHQLTETHTLVLQGLLPHQQLRREIKDAK
ncbi:hypothetical protein AX15_006488, partial [Amanita polypyramis BW_CC]